MYISTGIHLLQEQIHLHEVKSLIEYEKKWLTLNTWKCIPTMSPSFGMKFYYASVLSVVNVDR